MYTDGVFTHDFHPQDSLAREISAIVNVSKAPIFPEMAGKGGEQHVSYFQNPQKPQKRQLKRIKLSLSLAEWKTSKLSNSKLT